jgi:hypothetical protein
VWASPLMETVYPPATDRTNTDLPLPRLELSVSGDRALAARIVHELWTTAGSGSQRDPTGFASIPARGAVDP